MVVGIALTALTLPTVTGVTWTQLAPAAAHVPMAWLAGLVVLWLVGLLAHTVTLTGAMPGLTHRRALTLSLTGSAVANVLPLGGAAGIALNYRMARTWGHSGTAIGSYTVVTNIWDVLAKFLLPALVMPVLLVAAPGVAGSFAYAGLAAALVLAVVAATGLATLASPAAADRAGGLGDRVLGRWLRGRSCRAALVALQAGTSAVVRTSWRRLSLGMVLYTACLFALLLGCLTATGAGVGVAAVLAGFAVERLLTLAGLTPGGAGVVEVGLAAALLAFPGSSVGVALGVLLYRALTFGLEIPVGGLTLAGWMVAHHRSVRRAPAIAVG
ncbi:hypothetical protein GCM10023349_03830 [Nocardioides conyzicola]|uniref:Flippase-like domain-containing protein n=1 Tax=Nocardioides conyzicola TaxID=1651781 RepID=A0ABP8WM50_9ACTN